MLEKLFRLRENHTNIRTEVLAGLTTFLTMAYILLVQPAVLTQDFSGQPTGLDFGAVLLATCLASAMTSIFMGLWANYPIGLAPGMGENFFFVSVIMALSALGIEKAWQTALGIVFISGLIFLILSIFRIREMIMDAISPSMRNGIAVGIGLFIAFIGLKNGGLIIAKPGTFIGLNTHVSLDVLIFFLGLLVTIALHIRKIHGSILWGIFFSALLAFLFGKIHMPPYWFGLPEIKQAAAFQMNLSGAFNLTCAPFIIVFTFMAIFDALGTLIGVAEQAGLIKDNKLPRAKQVLVVDAAGTVLGACLGTSTVTCYIESITGVAYGARTGLAAVTTGLLFLAALFVSPLISAVASYAPITAPALVIVGAMMMQSVKKIDWGSHDECIPAFLTILGIPLSFSIADGLAFGFITYPVVKFLGGKGKEVSWLMYVLAAILLLYFIFVRSRLN